MELRPGYTQTEVRALPEEWTTSPLRQKSELISKGTTPTSVGRPFVDRGVSFVKIEAITDDGQVEVPKLAYIDVLTHELLKRSQLKKDDILFSIAGALGRTAVVPQDILPANTNQAVAFIRLKKDGGVDHAFLFHYLRSESVRRHVEAINVQGAQANLSLENVRDFEVRLPPLPEQRAIAGALGDVDALVGALTQLIAKQRDLKQAAMQQLLTGQTRLPGFSGEWEVVRIADVANVKTGPFGSSLHERDYVQAGTPIITVEHLGEFGVMHSNLPLVSDTDRHRLRAYSLETGNIVFSRVGSVDRNALIRRAEAGWLFSGRLLRVRPDKEKAFAPFLSYQFQGESFKRRVRDVAVGQTMASLNTQILNGLSVALPTLPEQTAIAAVLSDMDAELAALEQRLAKTRALKQGMLQELLTGRTRLV